MSLCQIVQTMQSFSTKLNARSFGGLHMSQDFRTISSTLALSPSGTTGSRGCYAATHSPTPKSPKARLIVVIVSILCVLVLGSISTPRLAAQIASGGVTGTVKDAAGAVIPDAIVTLKNTETGVMQTAHTTATGAYNFTVVPYGNYTLLVQHPGFSGRGHYRV